MKSSVITNETSSAHFIENYRFKVLGSEQRVDDHRDKVALNENSTDKVEQDSTSNFIQNQLEQSQSSEQNQSNQTRDFSSFDVNFVEELLKKTDELSENIVKLQMQIENQESEFNRRLEAEVARAKDDGKAEGIAQTSSEYEIKFKELETRFVSSIAKLDDEYNKFDEFLKRSEDELSIAAVGIAKEVILKEISANSNAIAYTLASSLVRDLNDAKNIQIRVNPSDSEYLKIQFDKREHIKIIADDAVGKGGVVIISEAGNIDATIQTRFEKLKNLVGE
ncbi:flagellar assembly protein FliH [Campylobacter sp. faydin G-24]|uniref:Flagellar assembly protein FliH n=1 Tax=Campylobacter anatolicus TaxID=2829105 RepID=A0ABS5HHR0_9BACT|nr:flagellar assembly protein FliH [Campylobacter anatolicus]MBR8463550.1 flagellar assembly protein FliH [Campylobacter anatolicus]